MHKFVFFFNTKRNFALAGVCCIPVAAAQNALTSKVLNPEILPVANRNHDDGGLLIRKPKNVLREHNCILLEDYVFVFVFLRAI